ncbi:MAG: hypothetical protein V1740_02450 [Candidatus Woesearchaeota archaeon]
MADGKEAKIILYIIKAEEYVKTNVQILSKLINQDKLYGIYVTVNRPYHNLVNILQKNNIKLDNLFIIDAITKSTGGEGEDVKNCIFLDSPTNLTDITISLRQAIEILKDKKKFIFFDTLSTLLIYNNSKSVIKFAHFLTGRMREWETQGIILSIEKEMDEQLINQLIQFCDEKVESK